VCNAQTGGVFKPAKDIIERMAGGDDAQGMEKEGHKSDSPSDSD